MLVGLQQRIVGQQLGSKHRARQRCAVEDTLFDRTIEVDEVLDHEAIHATGVDVVLLARSDEAREGLAISIKARTRHGDVSRSIGIDQCAE